MEWESYYLEASDYYNTAFGAAQKKRLGNLVIYNLVAMSIENYMTSVLMKSGFIPEHSSISSMYRELKKNHSAPEEFHTEVRFMNRFMNFCSLEPTPAIVPTDEEITRMVSFATSLKEWTREYLDVETKAS
jgi:hypothetical protein